MSYTTQAPAAKKTAYQRPYKTRSQRRLADRRKHDESADFKFLIKVAVGVGFLLLLAVGFAIKGMADSSDASPAVPVALAAPALPAAA
ncbi:hypothetical protein MUN81_00770 [Hymenobacter sp. 5317J-9]|uniref:hypothetical protein n=1 Tax=Hymenobacter sp. 5317J-9 TaxID=2932250 RepID=UPI001FD65618|nr:hypothetical protein [Hymenobacter sp. 5317J-9]UOQ98039.1 hypothetical protein MUN81_00770 [Hymenobacter sp. 5317J-9]